MRAAIMADPYACFVTESRVSRSQEEVLQRIPGWEDKDENAISPSQAALPLSRLCGDSTASSSDEEDTAEHRAPAFGLQHPLELASPDTQVHQEDSYNPVFESDRERSLSLHAECNVFGGLWGSRLITQSQDDIGGVAYLAEIGTFEQPEIVHKGTVVAAIQERFQCKDQNTVTAGEVSDPSIKSNKELNVSHVERMVKDYGRVNTSESISVGNIDGHIKQTPSPTVMPLNVCSGVNHEKNSQSKGMLDCNDKQLNGADLEQVQLGNQMASISDSAPHKKSLEGVSLNGLPVHCSHLDSKRPEELSAEGPMVSARSNIARAGHGSFCNIQNANKRKGREGDHALDLPLQKLHSSTDIKHAEGHRIQTSNINHSRLEKESLMKINDEGKCASGHSVLPSHVSTKGSIGFETDKDRDSNMNSVVCGVFPKSVVDVVMLVSGELPTPSPDDPDLLSVFMTTGVSLTLPLRNCNGQLICDKARPT